MSIKAIDARIALTLKATVGGLGAEKTGMWVVKVPKAIEANPPDVGVCYRFLAGESATLEAGEVVDYEVTVFSKSRDTVVASAVAVAKQLEAAGFAVRWREEGYLDKSGLYTWNMVASGA